MVKSLKKSMSPDISKPYAQNNSLKSEQFVTFWGVRGTMTTTSIDYLKYGGNTSCVEVSITSTAGLNSLIFDAGTGIIRCSENSLMKGNRVFHLFLSHMHYDHIIGLTRFSPLFRTDCEIHIYGHAKSGMSFSTIFQRFFSSPFFPIEYYQLPALKKITFHELNGINTILVNEIKVDIHELNHPQDAFAYRVWNKEMTSSIVYATDHEQGTYKDEELQNFIKDTDLFIFDSTYSELRYKNYVGWGHSTARFGAELAKKSDVKSFAIFHHDPDSTDKYLEEKILPEAQKIFENSFLSAEYQTIHIAELHTLFSKK